MSETQNLKSKFETDAQTTSAFRIPSLGECPIVYHDYETPIVWLANKVKLEDEHFQDQLGTTQEIEKFPKV